MSDQEGTIESINDKISQSIEEIETTEGIPMPVNAREKLIETLKEQHLHSRKAQNVLPHCNRCGVLLNDDNWRHGDKYPQPPGYVKYQCRNCRNELQRKATQAREQVTKKMGHISNGPELNNSHTANKVIELLVRDEIKALETAQLILSKFMQKLNSEGSAEVEALK